MFEKMDGADGDGMKGPVEVLIVKRKRPRLHINKKFELNQGFKTLAAGLLVSGQQL